ncbi:MAG: insulinase family protein [Bacteroidales bacterium]|nr:insulinase family protein [Bacteroidales bacterium]
MEYQFYTLPNGIKLVHKKIPSKVAHFGIIINTGSRDEADNEHGMAHFIEHTIFKGTKKRKTYHIISRLEDVGGDIDAYTTKEETCIYASFLHNYYERTIELISDIVFNSVFPEKELIKEKEVIIDEINSYKDSPADLIFDDFEELVFQNHPIGKNILGTAENLKKFKRNDVLNFIKNNYHTDQMVLCSVGNIKFKELISLLKKHFGDKPALYRKNKRKVFNSYLSAKRTKNKSTYQTHCITGNISYKMKDSKRIKMVLLNNIIGGPGMNSRLNLALREKHGFAYNIESFYTPYIDTGIFGIYFGTDNGNLEKCINVITKELKKVKEQKLGKLQLHKAKKQLIGQIAIASENYSSLMQSIGKSYLLFDKVDTLDEIAKKIELISAEDIQNIANEIFDFNKFSTLIYE